MLGCEIGSRYESKRYVGAELLAGSSASYGKGGDVSRAAAGVHVGIRVAWMAVRLLERIWQDGGGDGKYLVAA